MARRDPVKRAGKQRSTMAAGAGAHPSEGLYASRTQSGEESWAVNPASEDEVAMVRRAAEVLGLDHVALWMQSKIPSLANQTPYLLMQTQDGRQQVLRVLLKIEHGVY